ncbi:MAG: hypothetical protein QXN59_00685 [Candidatus Micrarchaeaceae archaeon]
MYRFRLAIDLDDTIANTIAEWLKEASLELGRTIKKDEINEYDIHKVLKLDKEYVSATFSKVWKKHHGIKLLDARIPQIMKRISEKYEVLVLTASPGKDKDIEEWLHNNNVSYSRLIKVEHAIEKAELGKRLGVSIFVDDSPKVAGFVVERGMDLIMVRQPWNKNFIEKNTSKHIFPVSNWAEVEKILEKLSKHVTKGNLH